MTHSMSLFLFSRRLLRKPCPVPAVCGIISEFSSSSSSLQSPNIERPRRSLLSVPGSDRRKIEKAAGLHADSVVLDLEDGVPLDRKEEARQMVVETLQEQASTKSIFGKSEVCVRINGLETGNLALQDLQAVLPYTSLDAIVIPKVEYPSDVDFVSRLISMSTVGGDQPRDIRILAAIESAMGLLNLRDIAKAGTGRQGHPYSYLDALIFASEDYCADLELIRTPAAKEMLHARSQIVTVAKAYGLQAIDMVHIDFRNLDDLQRECEEGRELGFTGKQAIHPAQLEAIHANFAPRAKDIDFARRCVEEYTAAATGIGGKGACVVDGIVVDAPVYKWAVKIMKRAEQAGMLNDK